MSEKLKPCILVKVNRSKGYEDTCDEIVYDDFLRNAETWDTEIYEPRCDECKHCFDDKSDVDYIKCCVHMNIFENDFYCAKFERKK